MKSDFKEFTALISPAGTTADGETLDNRVCFVSSRDIYASYSVTGGSINYISRLARTFSPCYRSISENLCQVKKERTAEKVAIFRRVWSQRWIISPMRRDDQRADVNSCFVRFVFLTRVNVWCQETSMCIPGSCTIDFLAFFRGEGGLAEIDRRVGHLGAPTRIPLFRFILVFGIRNDF